MRSPDEIVVSGAPSIGGSAGGDPAAGSPIQEPPSADRRRSAAPYVPALEAVGVCRWRTPDHEEPPALDHVTIRVDPGELVVIVGDSGAGTSTLLRCLAGLDVPDAGTIRVNGTSLDPDLHGRSARDMTRQLAVVEATDALFGHIDVLGNVRLVGRPAGRSSSIRRARHVLRALGLDGRRRAYPDELSVGERRRANLAVALMNEPAVILADDPTTGLDAETEELVVEALNEHVDDGRAAVVACHAPLRTARVHRRLELVDGRVR